MKRKIILLLMGGLVLLLAGNSLADVLISTYRVDGFDSNKIEVGATFTVKVQYRNNTGSTQTVVGAKFYADYQTTYLDAINEDSISDNLKSSLTSKITPNFTPAAGQFRYQRDAGGGTGLAVNNGQVIDCFSITFHVRQNAATGPRNIIAWLEPIADNVKVAIAGGASVAGTVNAFQDATLRSSYNPIFDGNGSAADPANIGNRLVVSWPSAAAISANNHDNDSGTANDANSAATQYSNAKLKHRIYRDNTLVHTSDPPGETAWTNTGLNDNQLYTFKVKAIDDCSPVQNESTNANTFSGKPHDYTPPGASIGLVGTKDREIDISWGCSDPGDLKEYIVIRKMTSIGETSVTPPPSINGASGDLDGTPPDVARDLLMDDGWTVVYEGTSTSLNDTELDNNKRYWYYAYACDRTGPHGGLVNQGNNWSWTPDGFSAVPGEAPNAISQFRAISDLPSGITFRWKTSAPPNYAGAKIVYTTDYDQWENLTQTSPEAVDKAFSGTGTVPVTDEATWTVPEAKKIYYFKAYAHNSSSLLWSPPVYGAAVPGGLAAGPLAVTVDLRRRPGSFGVNTLVFPTNPPYAADDGSTVSTVADLVREINRRRAAAVATIGFWDKEEQIPVGYVYREGSLSYKRGTDKNPDAMPLQAFTGYQIYVLESVPPFVLRGE